MAAAPDIASAPAGTYLGERDLLTREQARILLRRHGASVTDVIRVHLDSILYLGITKLPMTAWLSRTAGRTIVRVQHGWPAEPAESLLPRPDLAAAYATGGDEPDEQAYDSY